MMLSRNSYVTALVVACSTLMASCAHKGPTIQPVTNGGFERTLVYTSEDKLLPRAVMASIFNEVLIQSKVPFIRLVSKSNDVSTHKGQEYFLNCSSEFSCKLSLHLVSRDVIYGKAKELVQILEFELELKGVAGGYSARLSVPSTITTRDQSFLAIQLSPIKSNAELAAYFKRLQKIQPLVPVEQSTWLPKKLIKKLGIYGKVASYLLDELDKRNIKGTLPPSKSFNRNLQ